MTAPPTYGYVAAAEIEGICEDRFEPVWKQLENQIVSGEDVGASICITIDGHPVVDIWGGYFDDTFERPWERDTIITTHSITKTMTGLAALVLADSGELDLEAPVARYWPEFAENGKEGILVRHIISHSSGVNGWAEDINWEGIYDLDYSTALLARQSPWWEPGTLPGYHGINMGHLLSPVIQAITGLTLGQYFAEHVAKPIGADYHIGMGPECDHRAAPFVQGTREWKPPRGNSIAERVGLNPNLNPRNSSTTAWRRAEIGAANGQGNARSVATLHAAVASGGFGGVTLLSDKMRHRILEPQVSGTDLVIGIPITWGIGGYALDSAVLSNTTGHRIGYWGGNGGSLGYVDFDERMSVSYVMNRWMEGPYEIARMVKLIGTVNRCLGIG